MSNTVTSNAFTDSPGSIQTTDSSGNASYVFPNSGTGQQSLGTYTVTVTDPNTGAGASGTIQVVANEGVLGISISYAGGVLQVTRTGGT